MKILIKAGLFLGLVGLFSMLIAAAPPPEGGDDALHPYNYHRKFSVTVDGVKSYRYGKGYLSNGGDGPPPLPPCPISSDG